MRITEIITEAVGPNNIYHMTTPEGLVGIIKKGAILPSSEEIAHGWGFGAVGDHGAVSLTRDPRYYPFDNSEVQIIISKDALQQRHKISVHGWEGSEERVSKSIPFNNKYIRKVIFSDPDFYKRMKRHLTKLGIPAELSEWEDEQKAYNQIR